MPRHRPKRERRSKHFLRKRLVDPAAVNSTFRGKRAYTGRMIRSTLRSSSGAIDDRRIPPAFLDGATNRVEISDSVVDD